jgi:hypothetical protein
MAINWKTYNALPRLRSYKDALDHYNNVEPIRGCKDKLRPVGRRDQKWFNIHLEPETQRVHLRYGFRQTPLATFTPQGELLIYNKVKYDTNGAIHNALSAACRERIERITGVNVERSQHADWVQASSYINGKLVSGWFRMPEDGEPARIVQSFRANDPNHTTRLLLNPQPTVTHTRKRGVLPSIMARVEPFMQYLEAMARLTTDKPRYEWQTEDNWLALPKMNHTEMKEKGLPMGALFTRWQTYSGSDQMRANRDRFMELVEGDDNQTENWYVAMTWLASITWHPSMEFVRGHMRDIIHTHYRDELFEEKQGPWGTIAYDRFAKYFR